MEAPGDGGENWYYSQKDHHWYYYQDYDEDQSFHTGWLKFQNEWYWFNSQGWMEDNGYAVIDGVPYYFFINGHMAWNQYIGMKYYDENGQYDKTHDVRVIGKDAPTTEERDILSDYLYEISKLLVAQFVKDWLLLMFYTGKSYFALPNTESGYLLCISQCGYPLQKSEIYRCGFCAAGLWRVCGLCVRVL